MQDAARDKMKKMIGTLTPFRHGSANKALDDNVYIAELPRCKPPADTINLALCKPPPHASGLPNNFKTRLQPTWRERKVPAALPPVPKSSLMTAEPTMERSLKPRTFSGTNISDSKIFSNSKKGCHSAGALDSRSTRFPEMTSSKPHEIHQDVVDVAADSKKDNIIKVVVNKRPVVDYSKKNNLFTASGRCIKDSPRPQMNPPKDFTLSINLNQQSMNPNERRVAFGSSYVCSPYGMKSNPSNAMEQQRPTRSILRSRDEGQFFAKPPINPKNMIEKCPEKDLPLKRKDEPLDYLTLHMLARRSRGPQRFKYMRMLAARQGQV